MKSLWQSEVRDELKARVARLKLDQRPGWGKMSAPQMIVHLADSMRMTLGELTVAPKNTPLRYPPLKQLIVYCLPFPKSAPTAPELLARRPSDWSVEVTDLTALLDRFAQRDANDSWPDHPAFGPLSGRAWGILGYRHLDHHLRQFGV